MVLTASSVLDPRISHIGLNGDAEVDNDTQYKKQISESCTALQSYYAENYARHAVTSTDSPSTSPINPLTRSPRKHDFMARYSQRKRVQPLPHNELSDYFRSVGDSSLEWDGDALGWWKWQSNRFPNLSRLARDILSIPGMFRHVFKGLLLLTFILQAVLLQLSAFFPPAETQSLFAAPVSSQQQFAS